MSSSRNEFLPTNITRLPNTDWAEVRQQSKTIVQPWDFDTPVPQRALTEGHTVILGEHRDRALIRSLGNDAAWGAFTDAVPLEVKDKIV